MPGTRAAAAPALNIWCFGAGSLYRILLDRCLAMLVKLTSHNPLNSDLTHSGEASHRNILSSGEHTKATKMDAI